MNLLNESKSYLSQEIKKMGKREESQQHTLLENPSEKGKIINLQWDCPSYIPRGLRKRLDQWCYGNSPLLSVETIDFKQTRGPFLSVSINILLLKSSIVIYLKIFVIFLCNNICFLVGPEGLEPPTNRL